MIFTYKAIDQTGASKQGTIEAINVDVAISSLQKRGLIISDIKSEGGEKSIFTNFTFTRSVSNKDVVILSRQMATMFDAQVSALKVFRMLAGESSNPQLSAALNEVADDIQAGSPISVAMNKHPKIFSSFYVNMVKSGEESGKLEQTFMFLADYLDRTYEVTSKVKNALIYPAFVAFTFLTVMVLMFTMVIPKIAGILKDSGQEIPIYTQVVLWISNIIVDYGVFILVAAVIGGFFFYRFSRTEAGKTSIDSTKITIPYVKLLYRKLYLSRIADNMNTLLLSGIPMVRVLELTADVVDNKVYEGILRKANEEVKGGAPVSEALSRKDEIPGIFVQMMRVGEETGQLGKILKTMSSFYQREVMNAVDTMVGLIEPVMIVMLGLGVGILLAAVLVPIYNISAGM
jgi:type IV pilus assembly protein PilC